MLAFQDTVHLLLLIALVFIYLGSSRIITYIRARNWVSNTATVASISEGQSLVVLRYQKIKFYFPLIEYIYQYGGNSYSSNRVSFEKQNIWIPEVDIWGMPLDNSKKFWKDWSKDSIILIYVNPKNPAQSVIIKNLNKKRSSHHFALIIAGLLVLLIWAFFVM